MVEGYKTGVWCRHDEVPAKVNKETGEVILAPKGSITLPDGITIYENEDKYRKVYSNVEGYLIKRLKPIEYSVVCIMGVMSSYENNSLVPLNDDVSVSLLCDYFGIERHRLIGILKKLFDLGVYGKFEVTERDKEYKKYWIFNPYISHKGRRIEKDVANLFSGTEIAFYHRFVNGRK